MSGVVIRSTVVSVSSVVVVDDGGKEEGMCV